MEVEQVFLKLFGRNLISYKKLENGQVIGSGILNPFLDRLVVFRIIFMLILQSNFYKQYTNIGKWHGKMVANTFAP
ncbi:MAG: hypothetical protein ACFE9Z_16405, partial [Promethearchaeota archaeon]